MQSTETKIVEQGQTVEQLVLDNIDPLLKPYAKVFLDGLEVKPEYLAKVIPKEKTVVYIAIVPQGGGGGGGGGKNPLAVIASIALVVAAPWAAVNVLGLAAGSTTALMATAALNLVGGLAIQALFPPPTIDLGSLSGGNVTTSPTYTLGGTRNQIRKGQAIKRLYGQMRYAPDIAANPYTVNFGDSQYLYMLYDFGLGDIVVSDLKVGTNALANYDNVQYQLHRNTKIPPLRIYANDNDTVDFGTLLTYNNGVIVTTAPNTDNVIITLAWTQGLGSFDDRGNLNARVETFDVEYRLVGSGAWLKVVGALSADYASIALGVLTVNRANSAPFYLSIDTGLGVRGQYEIRIKKTTADSTDTRVLDAVVLQSITSVTHTNPLVFDKPHTVLELKIQANDQLNGVLDELTGYGIAHIDYWNGSAWVNGATSNPSHVALHMLRNTRKPIPDSRLDLSSFKSFADRCDESLSFTNNGMPLTYKRAQFNGLIDYNVTLRAAVDSVVANAYGSLTVLDGKYKIISDKPITTPSQLFTPRNSWGFNGSRTFNQQPHAIKVKFADKNEPSKVNDLVIYTDGYSDANAIDIQDVSTFGVTDFAQAKMYGLYLLSQNEFRSESFEISCDIENLIATRGDKVLIQHDVALIGGIPARIKAIDGLNVTIDELIELDSLKTYQATVRSALNVIGTQSISTTLINGDTVTLSSAISGISVGDLIVIGETAKVTDEFQVVSITPSSDLTATLKLVPYRADFWSFETTGNTANYTPQISDNDINQVLPQVAAVINQRVIRLDSSAGIEFGISWQKNPKYTSYGVYMSVSQEAYKLHTLTTENNLTINLPYSLANVVYSVKVVGVTAIGRQLDLSQATATSGTITSLAKIAAPSFTLASGTDHLLMNGDGSITSRIYIDLTPVDNDFVESYQVRYEIQNSGGVFEYVEIPKTAQDAYLTPVIDDSVYSVTVRTKAITGEYGSWLISTLHTVIGKTEPPSTISSATASIKDRSVVLNWVEVLDLDVYQYEIRKGTIWETAEYVARVNATQWIQEAAQAGLTAWLIKAIDTTGNYSVDAISVVLLVNLPSKPNATAEVIDNYVLLRFSSVAGTLPIDYYEIKKGTTLIGTISGEFSVVFERESGIYEYKIIAVDIAGNRSTTGIVTVFVAQPPDYVLNTEYDSTFNGTLTNGWTNGDIVIVPSSGSETWGQYLATTPTYTTLQSEIDAGFLNWLTPHNNSVGSYVETLDYGAVLGSSLITMTPSIVRQIGSQTVTPKIEVSTDNSTWTTYNGLWSVYARNFRYVRFTGTETPLDNKSQTIYSGLQFRLDTKLKNDGFTGTCNAGDPGGTLFNFQVQFVDVTSIVATPINAGEARDVVVDFVDTPYPTSFSVLLFNKLGHRVSGDVSFAIRGY